MLEPLAAPLGLAGGVRTMRQRPPRWVGNGLNERVMPERQLRGRRQPAAGRGSQRRALCSLRSGGGAWSRGGALRPVGAGQDCAATGGRIQWA